jgi:asparagine synthase (glutamine-hydrolysing)
MTTIAGAFTFDADVPIPGIWDHRERGLAMARRGECVWMATSAQVPTVHEHAGLVLTWNGRLDNSSDLRLRIGALEGHSDDELVLAVFERWGVAGLELLIGDWSLALWDRRRRTLHLARDYMGARPLYYSADECGVIWGSDLAELVGRCKRSDALSDLFAAHFMSHRLSPGLTPYETIRAVQPGTSLTFHEGGALTLRRLWTMTPGEIRYADSRRYEEQLRLLWADAVQARLRTRAPVWAELSGGLDSSSVVCMADRLIREGAVPARSIHLVSHATLHCPEGDERRFIAEVERQVGIRSEILGVEENQAHTDLDRAWVTPYALQGVGLATVRRVSQAGGRLILSGRMGDAIMGCQPDNSEAVFDDLTRLDLVAALRNLRGWSRATRKPFVELAWRLFAPVGATLDTGAALLAPPLRARLRDTPTVGDVKGVRPAKRTLARLVLGYALGGRLDIPLHPPDIVYTYPFAHRPLVEFVLAIPGAELSAPGTMRSLMRRAFRELLPARVLNRVSKGYYPPAAFRAALRHATSIADVNDLEVVDRGWIDAERLRQSLRAFTDGGGLTGGDIHRVFRLERWLQARRERPSIPQRKEVNSHAVLNA